MSLEEQGEQFNKTECKDPRGTGAGAFNPAESTRGALGPGWSAVGLHKSLSPLTRQEAQHGAQPSSWTIHMELVWPRKAWGDQVSLPVLAMEKQTCSGGWEFGVCWGFHSSYFWSVSEEQLTFGQSDGKNKMGLNLSGTLSRFPGIFSGGRTDCFLLGQGQERDDGYSEGLVLLHEGSELEEESG